MFVINICKFVINFLSCMCFIPSIQGQFHELDDLPIILSPSSLSLSPSLLPFKVFMFFRIKIGLRLQFWFFFARLILYVALLDGNAPIAGTEFPDYPLNMEKSITRKLST